jgi:putative oxidoreductase
VRRLYSTFASGGPGTGLLLLRLVAGIALAGQGFMRMQHGPPIGTAVLALIAIVAGALLLAGLWTPISGGFLAVLGLWNAVAKAGDPLSNILLGVIGAALALLGPGAWSVDARLYGWKRIDLGDRQN